MNRDSISLVFAVLFHAALAFALSRAPKNPKPHDHWVQLDVKKRPPPVELPPPPKEEPKPEPRPEKIKAPKPPPAPKAPIPNETREPPKTPPKEPIKPLFGLTAASTTTGDSSFNVAVGNTTIADPHNVAKKGEVVQPLAPAAPAAAPGPVVVPFKAASPLEIESEPEFDENSCGMIPYPDGEAKQLEIEGITLLRVEIDDHGKVHGVRVIKGVGHGLDDMAVTWMKTRCRFPKPAYAKGGKPVPFVITHSFTWQIDH